MCYSFLLLGMQTDDSPDMKMLKIELEHCVCKMETLTKEKIKAELEASKCAMDSMSNAVSQLIVTLLSNK